MLPASAHMLSIPVNRIPRKAWAPDATAVAPAPITATMCVTPRRWRLRSCPPCSGRTRCCLPLFPTLHFNEATPLLGRPGDMEDVIADYSRVQMPEFYYARVMRNLQVRIPVRAHMTHEEMELELRQRVEAVAPMTGSVEQYLAGARLLAGLAARIREHGGSVRFLLLPSSKLVRLLEERRFPRALFWDRFAEAVFSPTLHFEDVPALREFTCPDGSHLDFRDRVRFSTALVAALGLAGKSGGDR